MTVVAVISGPEKAGKTTLAHHVLDAVSGLAPQRPGIDPIEAPHSSVERVGRGWLRHWSGQIDSISDYLAPLMADTELAAPVVWDRSWACEAVYAKALDRPDRGNKDDWFLGEWYFGRAVQTTGVRVMLLGPSAGALAARRTPDDLQIDPAVERDLFRTYGYLFDWMIVDGADGAANQRIADAAIEKYRWSPYRVPDYCGPLSPQVLFVGEARNERSPDPAWLPFTSHYTARLGRVIQPYALKCGWTNALDLQLPHLRDARLIVACGGAAYQRVYSSAHTAAIYTITHPSALYRWGRYDDVRARVEEDLRLVVASFAAGKPPITEVCL